MTPTLRKNTAYVPGKRMFPQTRPFWKVVDLPPVLVTNAYEMSSGEPVKIIEILESGIIQATFYNQNGHLQQGTWTAAGKPRGSVHAEFFRPLQNREDLKDKLLEHFEKTFN